MNKEQIENLVEKIHSDLKLTEIPIPIKEVISNKGIRIKMAPSKEFSGILLRKGEGALIGVNSTESPLRQRFTLAHELGHFLLHKNKDAFVDDVNYRNNDVGVVGDDKEQEANAFAAAFLVPRKLLRVDIEKMAQNGVSEIDIGPLAKKYEVSKESMSYRLINLGLAQ